jgi:hypothetical protein
MKADIREVSIFTFCGVCVGSLLRVCVGLKRQLAMGSAETVPFLCSKRCLLTLLVACTKNGTNQISRAI